MSLVLSTVARRRGWIVFALAGACILSLFPPAASDARERGAPSTDTRALYCRQKKADCISQGYRECDYNNPAVSHGCMLGVRQACEGAFGVSSDCLTAERASSFRPPRADRPTENESRRAPEPNDRIRSTPFGVNRAR